MPSPRLIVPAASTTSYTPPARSEQRFFGQYGPHEIWQEDQAPAEKAAAQDKVDRLKAADAAVAELEGSVTEAHVACPSAVNHALEVLAVDAEAEPIVGLLVELHREGQPGILKATTNAQGIARFEGLLDSDQHGLWIPALARGAWDTKGSEALPEGRATVAYEASWGGTSAKKERPAEHVAKDGECMWTLSRRYGLTVDALWAANEALAQGKRNANVIAPGDVVKLPAAKDEPLASARVGQRVKVACTQAVARANLRFHDVDGKGRAGVPAVIRVTSHDGRETLWETKTNGDGGIDEAVPADAKTIDVVLDVEPEPQPYHFNFAYLDPIETIAGVQGRLANLGYHCGSERGELGPLTRRALREFQKEHGLTDTGEPDGPTKDALEGLY